MGRLDRWKTTPVKKERVIKPDGRYLIYYSFGADELVPAGARANPLRRARPQKRRRSRRAGRPPAAGRL